MSMAIVSDPHRKSKTRSNPPESEIKRLREGVLSVMMALLNSPKGVGRGAIYRCFCSVHGGNKLPVARNRDPLSPESFAFLNDSKGLTE
ncbi:hypothetical protein EVAR_14434_1 [Eumeta japonica]|uniref:Uncharacterized protein n=1 Tax=Eumeta variegata TaxID=151549 RepID=A0A4C1TXR8_EUMVA|nr:hypothetical protein EVAR_14434_1 [Eumeta japonica]